MYLWMQVCKWVVIRCKSAFSGRISSHFLHCQGQICPGNAASTTSCRSSTYTRTCRLRGIEEETGPFGGRFMPLQDNVLGSTWKKLVAKCRTTILRRLVTLWSFHVFESLAKHQLFSVTLAVVANKVCMLLYSQACCNCEPLLLHGMIQN